MANNDFTGLWVEARKRYAEISGKDLKELPMPRTTDELMTNVERQNKDYKHFREKAGTLFTALSWAVKPIELVGNLAAGAASAAFPPASMCFGAAMYLINAARGVSASLDAITELLGMLKDFTVRLKVYNREDLSQELREKLTEILTTVIEIFARSTKVVKDGAWSRLKSFGRNILLGSDTRMQGLMSKLDKLTESEDRLVGAETLVETKKTSRNVEAVQVTLDENTVQLSHMSITTNEMAQDVSQMSTTQNEMAQGVGQILSELEAAKTQAKQEKDVKHMEAVKKVLKPSKAPQDRFDEIRRDHVEGSGDWICDEVPFQKWEAGKAPILWVSGMPGSGKSFLAYTMIRHVQALHADEDGAAGHTSVAYFFFRDNKDATRSFEQALRDIASQLAQTDELYAKHIAECVHSESDVASIRSAWQTLFVDYYIEGEQSSSSAYIVFDGIDESFEEGRNTFFELLGDVTAEDSKLRVAMLGRPQILDEITEGLENTPPHIHVNSQKNGGDIAHFVEASIGKSRALKQVSRELKDEIVQTLTSKAGGMFMWVRLMIAELSKKSRPSAIKDALNKAPKGLSEMLRHVLSGVSASLKDVQDAEDLNDMLMWVALAKRPLMLGEVDAMLRLKSPEGEGILNLEGKLRTQFASFFVLTRDDALTTADLQSHKHVILDDDDDTVAGAEVDGDDGLDDVENDTEFTSNPRTTEVSFVHASISDFFRDPKQGKVSAGGETPAVGVEVDAARLAIAKICVDLLTNDSLLDRMKEAVSLRPYAGLQWKEHLEEVEIEKVDRDERIALARLMAKMLRDEKQILIWNGPRNMFFFTAPNAQTILNWLVHPNVVEHLDEDASAWIKSVEGHAIDLFEPAMKYSAARWLKPEGIEWKMTAVVEIVYTFLKRKAGSEVTKSPTLQAADIVSTAEWAGFEQTADWHRRVAMVLREYEWYDQAIQHFQKAMELDPHLWMAKAGLAKVFREQEKYEDAIKTDEEVLQVADIENEKAGKVPGYGLWDVNKVLAECYSTVADDIESDGDLMKKVSYNKKALDHYQQAFKIYNIDYDCIWCCLDILHGFLHPGPPWESDEKEKSEKHSEPPELPAPIDCHQQVMELAHDLAETQKDETHTNLTKCLHEFKYQDDFFEVLATAAHQTGELEWLQGRYREAITVATKDLQPVIAACLSLCLAQLYYKYGDEEEKAVRIWEQIGTEGSTSTRTATDIAYARQLALNELGMYCLRKALADDSNAERFIAKMERIATRKRYGGRTGLQDSIPPNDIALYLAAWYRKHGREEDAREIAKPHIKDAMIILSDDDPTNDMDGYVSLSKTFLALGDEQSYLAVMHTIRPYRKDVAVLKDDEDEDDGADEKGSGDAKDGEGESAADASKTDVADDDNGDEDDDDSDSGSESDEDVGNCDGCGDLKISWDEMHTCLLCGDFCPKCFKKLEAGTLPYKSCDPKQHGTMYVPVLQTRFKKGETLVGDQVMGIDAWKAELKKSWGL